VRTRKAPAAPAPGSDSRSSSVNALDSSGVSLAGKEGSSASKAARSVSRPPGNASVSRASHLSGWPSSGGASPACFHSTSAWKVSACRVTTICAAGS